VNRSSTHPALYVVRHIKKLLALQYIDIKIGHPSLRCSDLFFSSLLWYCVCVCVCVCVLISYIISHLTPLSSRGQASRVGLHTQSLTTDKKRDWSLENHFSSGSIK
jgi:hypothetical protein